MTSTTAKGTMGDRSLKQLALLLGWPEVVDLARTYPGADLWCRQRDPLRGDAYLWLEAKRYSWRDVDPDARAHAAQCAKDHAPDTHLVVCFQNDLASSGKQWRVKMLNGVVIEGPAPLFLTFALAKPPYGRAPPYTTGGKPLPGTGAKPVGWATDSDGSDRDPMEG
jgi:hypothetical protein